MTDGSRRVLFLVASARRSGNSETLARRAEASLAEGSVDVLGSVLAL